MAANATRSARTTTKSAAKVETPAEQITEVLAQEPQAQPEVGAEHPYAYLLEKDPTSLHTNYAEWLQEQTGEEMSERDLKIIQMVCVTRMPFQRSEKNQKDLQSRKEAWKQQQAAKKAEQAKKTMERLTKLANEAGVDLAALVAKAEKSA